VEAYAGRLLGLEYDLGAGPDEPGAGLIAKFALKFARALMQRGMARTESSSFCLEINHRRVQYAG